MDQRVSPWGKGQIIGVVVAAMLIGFGMYAQTRRQTAGGWRSDGVVYNCGKLTNHRDGGQAMPYSTADLNKDGRFDRPDEIKTMKVDYDLGGRLCDEQMSGAWPLTIGAELLGVVILVLVGRSRASDRRPSVFRPESDSA